jgi:hypothetical protein
LSAGIALKVDRYKLDRGKVDLSNGDVARRWSKHFGKSVEEIAIAIAKVGTSAQTVKKELGCLPIVPLTD